MRDQAESLMVRFRTKREHTDEVRLSQQAFWVCAITKEDLRIPRHIHLFAIPAAVFAFFPYYEDLAISS
jgi:hypothetical protein